MSSDYRGHSVAQAFAQCWHLEGVLFTVSRLPPAACRRLQAITLADFLAAKMAVPIHFKMQKGYYFHCLVEQDVQMMHGG